MFTIHRHEWWREDYPRGTVHVPEWQGRETTRDQWRTFYGVARAGRICGDADTFGLEKARVTIDTRDYGHVWDLLLYRAHRAAQGEPRPPSHMDWNWANGPVRPSALRGDCPIHGPRGILP